MKYRVIRFILIAAVILAIMAISGMTGCAGSAKNQAQAYIDRGYALAGQGKYDEAIAEYNKAIEADPNNFLAYNYRGEAYKVMGEYDLATADFNKAIELNPDDQRANINRALVQQLIALAKIQHGLPATTATATTTPTTTKTTATTSTKATTTTTTSATGAWPTFSDENKIVIYQGMISGNINDDNGNRTYHVNPAILRACGGKPNDNQTPVYKWSASGSLPPGIRLDANGLVTGSGAPLQEGTQTFAVEVTDGKLTAKGTITLAVTRYDVTAKNGIPGVPGAWAILQQWPQEVVDKYPLPAGKAGHNYGVTLPILGGTPPYDFTLVSSYYDNGGTIADSGLSYSGSGGVLYGIFSSSIAGKTWHLVFQVKDSSGEIDPYKPEYSIQILP